MVLISSGFGTFCYPLELIELILERSDELVVSVFIQMFDQSPPHGDRV